MGRVRSSSPGGRMGGEALAAGDGMPSIEPVGQRGGIVRGGDEGEESGMCVPASALLSVDK